jgi:uncharacterized membrane protein (GlpM family)
MALLLRFLIGGRAVCVFAVLADLLKPKSVAGLFGAAPSVALASLALTVRHDGREFAAIEARSMMAGAAAFFLYTVTCAQLVAKYRWSVLQAAVVSFAAWFGGAFVLWFLLLRRG